MHFAISPATAGVTCPGQVDLDAHGGAAITLTGAAPGCCMLQFTGASDSASTDSFACVRVLPKDDFRGVPDDQITFAFVYDNVLRYYHLLHPAMDGILDLSAEHKVKEQANRIWTRIRDTAWDGPHYMPRTRKLSAGKVALLLRWCDIVALAS